MSKSTRIFSIFSLIAFLALPALMGQDRDRDRHRHRHDSVRIEFDGSEIAGIVADALREARRSLRSVDLDLEIRDAIREARVDESVREALRESRRSLREARRDSAVDVYVGGMDLSEIIDRSLRSAEDAVDSIPIERIVRDSVDDIDLEHVIKDVLRGVERALRAVERN